MEVGKKIKPPADLVEMAAALEVTKTFAFLALVMSVESVSGAAAFRANALAMIAGAEIDMPPEDASKYRAYAEVTVEELFGRLSTEAGPLNPKSS
jgi:hypothetical protein